MKKTTRIIYLIIGVVFPIFIGALHTYVHFTELTIPEVQETLSTTLSINGKPELYWNAWGLISFMMGWSFIIIGLLNITIFKLMKKEDYPPVMALITMLLYLFGVIYSSHLFNAPPQFYGAIFGSVLTTICLILTLKGRE